MTTTSLRAGISPHECRTFAYLKGSRAWRTAKEIAEGARISHRTANKHTRLLSESGLLERMETHPAPMFRFTTESAQRNPSYIARIANACEAFGIDF